MKGYISLRSEYNKFDFLQCQRMKFKWLECSLEFTQPLYVLIHRFPFSNISRSAGFILCFLCFLSNFLLYRFISPKCRYQFFLKIFFYNYIISFIKILSCQTININKWISRWFNEKFNDDFDKDASINFHPNSPLQVPRLYWFMIRIYIIL